MSSRTGIPLELEAERHARAKKALAEAFPNLDPDDEAFTGTLEGETDFYDAIDAKVEQLRQDLAESQGLRVQAEAYAMPLLERAKRLESRADAIKARLLRVLQEVGEKRINRPGYGLTVKANGNPAVKVFDAALLPDQYLRHKPAPPPEPDMKAIREALNDPDRRAEVDFAATFDNAAPTLQIKLK